MSVTAAATRPRVAGLLALGAALTGLGAAPTWASAPVAGVLGAESVSVTGAQVLPAAAGLALVCAAAAVVLLLAGRALARVVGGLVLLTAAAGLVLALTADPVPALTAAAGSLTGVPELAGPATAAGWGRPVLVLGLVVAGAAGLGALLGAGRWARVGRRFERDRVATVPPPGSGTPDDGARTGPGAADGADGAEAAPAARAAQDTPGSASDRAGRHRAAALDAWEAIERGEDPSL